MKFGYRDRFDRHEIPVQDFQHGRYTQPIHRNYRIPANRYQAMMEVSVGETEPMDETEREADWLGLQHLVDVAGLSEREQIVIDCIVFGGMSLTETADYVARAESTNRPLSKMQIARIRDAALRKLRHTFLEEKQNGNKEEG